MGGYTTKFVMHGRCQTYSYLPSRTMKLLFGWYQMIVVGDRGTLV